ncbi:MAG: CvpA family protein [Firmicutes bacterium]|nr:CvpA family protein [Bacillota bacterium]
MNWLDALLVAVVVFFALAGAQKGFVRQLFGVIGTIASYLVAIYYGKEFILQISRFVPLTKWFPQWFEQTTLLGFSLGDVLLRLLGFFLLFSLIRLLFSVTGDTVHALFNLPLLGLVNSIGGMLFGAVQGILIVLILVAAARLTHIPFLIEALGESMIAPRIFAVLPVVYEQMKTLLLTGRSM